MTYKKLVNAQATEYEIAMRLWICFFFKVAAEKVKNTHPLVIRSEIQGQFLRHSFLTIGTSPSLSTLPLQHPLKSELHLMSYFNTKVFFLGGGFKILKSRKGQTQGDQCQMWKKPSRLKWHCLTPIAPDCLYGERQARADTVILSRPGLEQILSTWHSIEQ